MQQLLPKIKERNTQLKLQIQNYVFLSRSFGKIVSEQLSKAKSYLEKKLFYDDDPNRQRYDAYILMNLPMEGKVI